MTYDYLEKDINSRQWLLTSFHDYHRPCPVAGPLMPRFVVLYHAMPPLSVRPDHWDLMLEKESPDVFDPAAKTLETWALASQPLPGPVIMATKLEDHRAYYLDNDGSLANGRGIVTRQISGEFIWIINEPDRKKIKMFSDNETWMMSIRQVEGTDFEVEVKSRGSGATEY